MDYGTRFHVNDEQIGFRDGSEVAAISEVTKHK